MKVHRNRRRNRYNFVAPSSNTALYKFICVFIVLAFLVIIVSVTMMGSKTVETANTDLTLSDTETETTPPLSLLGNVGTVSMANSEIGYGHLILVNYQYPCVYDEPEMVPILENSKYNYKVADYEVKIAEDVFEYVDNLLGDFEAQNGGTSNVIIACAYRSKEVQEELYNEKLETDGQEEADKWIAKAGYSEHQTGHTLDLALMENDVVYDYTGTGEYAWINNNCYKYGFIVRYPVERSETTGIEYEPWHFRYVGEPHAEYIFENDLCFEDYIELLHTKSVSDPLVIYSETGKYAVYYCAENTVDSQTQITVPESYEYEISGDNVGGFIVTVKLS